VAFLIYVVILVSLNSCASHPERVERWEVDRVGDPAAFLGPEDLAFDPDGAVVSGLLDGRVVRFTAAGDAEVIAETGGRPLGIRRHPSGVWIVADGRRGLLAIDAAADVRVLHDRPEGERVTYVNGLDIAPDGIIYFTQPSSQYEPKDIAASAMTGDASGRLLAHDLASGRTRIVADGPRSPNGVAIVEGGAAALVSETFARRIVRVDLTHDTRDGKAAPTIWTNNLPGYPDNVSVDAKGRVWCAIHTDRSVALDTISMIPILPQMIAPLFSGAERPPLRTAGRVMAFEADGNVLLHLRDGKTSYGPVSSVYHRGDRVYLGSPTDGGVGVMALPDELDAD